MTRAIAAGFLLALAGCAVRVPEGFVRVPPGSFDWRALSSDGVVVGWRDEPNREEGSLDFWAGILRRHLQERDYQFQSEAPAGSGRELIFLAPTPVASFYVAALFVEDDRIHVLEAAGPMDRKDATLAVLRPYILKLPSNRGAGL